MNSAFQQILSREILAAIAGNLMQALQMPDAFAGCIPNTPSQ
jgi:hypothetical protein